MNVTLGLAFLAGLASFLSPCVFALIPAYISYLSGRTLGARNTDIAVNRWYTFRHGVAFVLGFSFIFILLGLTASLLGQLTYQISPILAKIGGIAVVLFGLHMTGLLRIPFLEYDLRPQSRFDQQRGYVSSFLMGVVFSAGWSPCTGPVLGAIFMLAFNAANIGKGAALLAAYSIGLGIPFLAAALGVEWVTFLLKKYRKLMHYVEVGMGIVLIIIGLLLFLGIFEQIAQFAPFIDFGL